MASFYRLAKRTAERGNRRFRELTAALRLPPRLLLIGAQKSGTTSLYRYLVEHSEVLAGFTKEVRYFNAYYDRGPDWYRAQFPLARARETAIGPIPVTLDASTGYLPSPLAPARVAAELPDVKLVVLLRDPIDRAWSHYRHSVRDGHEELAFGEALAAEEHRLQIHYDQLLRGDPEGREFSFYSYITRGRYADQLNRWFQHFGRERFLIKRTEDLLTRPLAVTNEVLDFVGLSPLSNIELQTFNVGPERSPMPVVEREKLEALFGPENDKLYAMLGWDTAWPYSS